MVAHLKHGAQQQAPSAPFDFTSVLFRRDGSPVDFAAVAAAVLDGASPAPTSYPEPRHLVGISPSDLDADALLPPVVRVFDREAPAPLGDGRQRTEDQWLIRQSEWESAFVLRELLAGFDDRLAADCGGEGKVLQHNLSDRQRLTPYRCQVRSVCPCCGRAYGLEKGLEVAALMDGVLAPGRLVVSAPTVKTWALVLSCDKSLSTHVHDLVIDGKVEPVRKILRHLTEDVQATLRDVFGAGVAAVVSWHWWHSSNPLLGTHLHAHVTVPNVDVRLDPVSGEWTPTLRPLRVQGVLSADELRLIREGFGARALSHRWARAAGVTSWAPNAHVRFTTTAEGSGYRHRARYDVRSPVSDLLKMVEPAALRDARNLHGEVLDDTESEALEAAWVDVSELANSDNAEALSWWVHAAQFWQSVQTLRYTGWLVNSARKSLGLLKTVSEGEPEWSSVGLYRLLDVSGLGVRVERFGVAGRREELWHGDHVDLLPPPSVAKGYYWNDAIRPEIKAGPPAAWISRAGLARENLS